MPNLPWKRFWAPREGTLSLGDGGFLTDPEAKHGGALNPDLVALETLDEHPCLVLLGEPGIGKSTVAEEHYQRVRQAAKDPDHAFIFLDLRAYGSEDRIVRAVFESEAFLTWRRGGGLLDLYFDSLDECSVRVAHVAALLIEQLRDVPHTRLRLRIGCRTAEWPALLETGCQTWFGASNVKVLELAPLRRTDVRLAAESRSMSSDNFVEALQASAVVPLAIKPITLDFLLALYATTGGTLPSTQIELYEKGCTRLCQEHNESRLAARHTGVLGTDERMDVASWIAATMTFGGKSVIRIAPSNEPMGPDDVEVSDLIARDWNASEASIRDVITVSGLFSSRGPNRLGWAHKTYSEFLAARFLTRRNMPLGQLGDLVLHHHDQASVVPQLREATAWIGSMRPDVFRLVAERDPQVLLSSDVVKADAAGRQGLVDHLLNAFDREQAIDDWDERVHYRKFKHPLLGQQLRPFIVARTKNIIVRRAAIGIARDCECRDVLGDLLSIALDKTDERHIREQAVYAVSTIGDEIMQLQLRPLLSCDAQEDPQDELRGLALRALYPIAVSPAELFGLITPLRDSGLVGAYTSFLNERAHALSRAELPEALRWAIRTHMRRSEAGPLNTLRIAALRKGWDYVDDTEILPELTRLVERRLATHDNPFGNRADKDVERPNAAARRAVCGAVLDRIKPEQATLLLYGDGPLLDWDDFDWLIEHFEANPDGTGAANIAKLVASLSRREEAPDRLSRVIGLALANPVLHAEMSEMIDAIDLDSPRAVQMRETYRLVTERHDYDEPEGVADPVARIAELVPRCEQDVAEWWWQLTRDLSLKPNDTHYHESYAYRVTEFAAWTTLSAETQQRILALARQYILEGDPANEAWFGTDGFGYAALGGYRALQLVLELDPAWLHSLDPSIFQKWVWIIGAYPSKPSDDLTRIAWTKRRADLLRIIIECVEHQRDATRVDANERLDACWNEDIARALAAKAAETDSPSIQNALVGQGIHHGDDRFVALAERMLRTPQPPDVPEPVQAGRIALLSTVIRSGLSRAWTVVTPLMQDDRPLAREAWLQVATNLHRDVSTILAPLTPDQLADLFIWLANEFPPGARRRRTGWVGPAESIADFRDALLGHLKERGDWKCLPAMDRIIAALPDLPLMRLHRVQARRAAAQGTWQPVSPPHLAALAKDGERRFVESEGQLLSLVVESMNRLQATLHDELSSIRDLWDKTPTGWRPVEEADVSNRIARHLRTDLATRTVVVNREVKIRRGLPGLEGQQTDIYVDALAPSQTGEAFKRLSVVVEVKGCWNKEVLTAPQDQLAARYLRDNSCDHGLYVVAWFTCGGWEVSDWRYAQAQRLLPNGLEATRNLLVEQAASASRDGKVIRAFTLDAAFRADRE